MALPPVFDGFVEHSKRVSPTHLVIFERNRCPQLPAAMQHVDHVEEVRLRPILK